MFKIRIELDVAVRWKGNQTHAASKFNFNPLINKIDTNANANEKIVDKTHQMISSIQ